MFYVSMHKNTITRAKKSGWEIIAPGCSTDVRRDAIKWAEWTVSYYPHHPFPKLAQYCIYREILYMGKDSESEAPDFAIDPSTSQVKPGSSLPPTVLGSQQAPQTHALGLPNTRLVPTAQAPGRPSRSRFQARICVPGLLVCPKAR